MPPPGLAETTAYNLMYWTGFYAFTFGWGLRAAGRENLPLTGPVLLLANHQSFLDPFVIAAAARRRIAFLARGNLWANRTVGRVMTRFWGMPIDRGFGREGLAGVLSALDKGRPVLMFPEGERTHTGALQPLKAGVSLLVKWVTCPIVPVGVAGAYQVWPRHERWPTPDPLPLPSDGRSMAVAFGPPLDPARYKRTNRGELLGDLQGAIRSAVELAERVRRVV